MVSAAPARAEMVYAGVATWSGEQTGRYTASGETYDADDLTCAHPTFAFDTLVRVHWRGRSVICRVNDRGPAKSTGVAIDLSRGAARVLGMIDAGRVNVITEKLGRMLE